MTTMASVSGFYNNIQHSGSRSQTWSKLSKEQPAQTSRLWSTDSVNADNDGRIITTTAIENKDKESLALASHAPVH